MFFLPIIVYADDKSVLIDGIYYNLGSNEALNIYFAEVTKNPEKYKGNIVIPAKVSYDDKEYSVTTIGSMAFMDCSELKSVEFPEGLTHIESEAFSGCTGLIKVCFPNSISFTGNNVFYGCTGITEITLPDNGIYTFSGHEFKNCTGLTSIDIPSCVTTIDGFTGCSGLTSIYIPKTVTEIKDYSFTNCENLSSIIVESGNRVYDSRDNCNAIIETASNTLVKGCNKTLFPENVPTIGKAAFYGCTTIETLTIPNTIKTIGKEAFSKCTGIEELNLPNSITTIEREAFNGCNNLTTVVIPNSLNDISSVFTNCRNLVSVTIPEGVTNISDAFTGCSSLASITIPKSVTDFYMAFYSCTSLKTITIPEGVIDISGEAFAYSGLISVYIPSSALSIRYNAFECCKDLKDVYCYAETPPLLDSRSFWDDDLPNAVLHVPSGSIDLYKKALIWKDFGRIVALKRSDDPSGIKNMNKDADSCPTAFFSIEGIVQNGLHKGINIVRQKDGSTRKVFVK